MDQGEVIAAVDVLYGESDRVIHDILSRIMLASGVEPTQRMARLARFERPSSRFWLKVA